MVRATLLSAWDDRDIAWASDRRHRRRPQGTELTVGHCRRGAAWNRGAAALWWTTST